MPLSRWDDIRFVSRVEDWAKWGGFGIAALGFAIRVIGQSNGNGGGDWAKWPANVAIAGGLSIAFIALVSGKRKRKLEAKGTLLVEAREKYTDKPLPAVTCTTDGGRIFPALLSVELPVGEFSATCTLDGYIDEKVDGEIRKGETTSKRVELEQQKGSILLLVLDTDRGAVPFTAAVSIDGEQTPIGTCPHVVKGLPAGKVLHMTHAGEEIRFMENGVEVLDRKLGPGEATVTVRGGVDTVVELTLPVLFRRDKGGVTGGP